MRSNLAAAMIFSIGLAGANAAEPGYFRVSGVAAGDTLNVRSEPDAKAEVLEELPPEFGPMEILEVNESGWGRLVIADSNGWVAMRFLSEVELPLITGTLVPDGLQCVGTEPFWSATLSGKGLELDTDEGYKVSSPLLEGITAVGRRHRFALLGRHEGVSMTAMLGRFEQCSDGMSDRDYGWRIDLLVQDTSNPDSPSLYEGCCHLPLQR